MPVERVNKNNGTNNADDGDEANQENLNLFHKGDVLENM